MDTILSIFAICLFIFILCSIEMSGKYGCCSGCGINTTRPKETPWKCGDCEDEKRRIKGI